MHNKKEMAQGIYSANFPEDISGICIHGKEGQLVLASFAGHAIRAEQSRFPVFFRDPNRDEWYRMKQGEEMPLRMGAEYGIGCPETANPQSTRIVSGTNPIL